MAKVSQEITLSQLWNTVDRLKRPEPPEFVNALLQHLKSTNLIDNTAQVFLFDTLPLYYLLYQARDEFSRFGDSTMIPLFVKAGLAEYFFSTPNNTNTQRTSSMNQVRRLFNIGPLDFDIKISNLDTKYWSTVVEWLSQNSGAVIGKNKTEYYFTDNNIWNHALPLSFPVIEQIKNKTSVAQKPVIKATFIENIDGQHTATSDHINDLYVLILELGFWPEHSPQPEEFEPHCSIHISNIPQHDTRLQKSPNSTLAKITPQVHITNVGETKLHYPEASPEYLKQELQLLLDPEKPLESFVAAISFFRKINIKRQLGTEYLFEKRKQNEDVLYTKYILSPFIDFYEQFSQFLAQLPEKIKITHEYEATRFISDLAVIAITVGPIEFSKILIQTGLHTYLDQTISNAVEKIDKQETEHDFYDGLIWELVYQEIKKTNHEYQINFTSVNSQELTTKIEKAPRWDGLTSLLQVLSRLTDTQLTQYPLYTFIKLFCEPFIQTTQK